MDDRLRAALAGALAVLLLCGCDPESVTGSPEPSEPDDPPGEIERPDASVDIDVEPGASSIGVHYRLTNDGDTELLVPNLLPTTAGTFDDDAGLAYVTGDDDGAVMLSQRVFAMPETDVSFAQIPRVGVTRVAPGADLEVSLEVPLPLERRYPWGDDLGKGTIELPDPVGAVRFCLGVVPPPYQLHYGLEREDGVSSVTHGSAINAGQYLFCSDPVEP